MANEFLRDRIQRKLASLPDERLYQVLDFVEFLETKYAEPTPATSANFFQRFAEGVEDRLRQGKVSTQTIAEAMNLMHRAVGVMNGVAQAGRTVASDIVDGVNKVATVATEAAAGATRPPGAAPGGTAGAPPASGGTAQPAAGTPPNAAPPTPPPSSGDRPS